MLLFKNKLLLNNFSEAGWLEWLETNGLGGWSGSSLSGCNTRRYHGLLMAAIVPPTDRMLLVSKLDETILMGDNRFELGTNDYGDAISPKGFQYQCSFTRNFFPEWIYEVPGLRLQKTVTMVHGENTTLIRYEVLEAEQVFTMEFLPLIAARGYHSLQHANDNIFWETKFNNGLFHNQPYQGAPDIFISIPGSSFRPVNTWYYKFNYAQERHRGLDYEEDLFNHGVFSVDLKKGNLLHIMISTEDPTGKNPAGLFEQERNRKIALLNGVPGDLLRQLVLAADQFIVNRKITDDGRQGSSLLLKTIIAGYHWFTDWGRDTMISLPGLCLHTGRYEDAKKILTVFAKSVSMGMLPNRFINHNESPEYNNVDGTLWFFNAAYAYQQVTGDERFILEEILPVLKNIIDWHFKGTRFNIHADSDGLLYAGAPGQQLTWMDARVDNWVVTPRMGKPVEIEALWFNALKIFEYLLNRNGESDAARDIQEKAERAKKNFLEKFWNFEGNYLIDNIDENENRDESLRPNQIFAICLPFPLIENEKAKAILDIIRLKLLTATGLRSLSPDDPKYKGDYGGNPFRRDSAYHQGTVWSWLMGPYLEAGMKFYGEKFRPEAMAIVEGFSNHINKGCIGSISEIFDGDAPNLPKGCVAQAWSVAEMLRVIKTYSLLHVSS
jgi:predicted glycogen debranching enzyme